MRQPTFTERQRAVLGTLILPHSRVWIQRTLGMSKGKVSKTLGTLKEGGWVQQRDGLYELTERGHEIMESGAFKVRASQAVVCKNCGKRGAETGHSDCRYPNG